MRPLRLEPAAPRSRVKHSSIEPLRSQKEEYISIQKVNEMGGSHNQYMHGSRKFLQRGSNSDNLFFFLMKERIKIPRPIIGPPAKRHLNGVSLASR